MSPPPPPAPPPPQAMLWEAPSTRCCGAARLGWTVTRAPQSRPTFTCRIRLWTHPTAGLKGGAPSLCSAARAGRRHLIVSAVVLAITLIPLGFAVTNLAPAFPWYAPAVTILVLGLSAVLWLALSAADVLPSTHAPWALSPRTLWLDLCATPPPPPPPSRSRGSTWSGCSCAATASLRSSARTTLRACAACLKAQQVLRAELKERVVVLSLEWGRGGGSGSSDHAPPPTDAAFEAGRRQRLR